MPSPKAIAEVPQFDALLGALERARKAKSKASAALEQAKADEDEAEIVIVAALKAAGLQSARGKKLQVTLKPVIVPTIDDFDKFCAYVKKTGAFELFQRRLGVTAVRERWEQQQTVPGVKGVPFTNLSVTVVKGA